VLGRGALVAIEHGHLADRLRRAASASPWPASEAIFASASVQACTLGVPLASEERRRPADPPDRVMVVLALFPAGEQGPAVLGRLLLCTLRRGDVGEARGRVHEHVVVAD